MQVGEAIAKFLGFKNDEKKEEAQKKPLKIRISIFFDGTLNNRANIEEREKHEMGIASDSYKEHGDGGQNSYDNGRTNIALMEPHAPYKVDKKGETGYDYVFKLYVEGQGTFNKTGDTGYGYSMGAGDSGVASRARQGINLTVVELRAYLAAKPPEKYAIEKIDVDVFGFSRGAATARQCIFLLSDEAWLEGVTPLGLLVQDMGYKECTNKHIEVKFAGVYDTVVSVHASQYNWWSDNKLNQRSIALATKSVHLAAAEEHRQDFPLHTINSAKDAGKGKEYYLPGVHSDVGGSYNLANETLLNAGMENKILKITIASGSYRDMSIKREELVSQRAFTRDQLEIVVTKKELMTTMRGMQAQLVPTEGKLVELRRIHGKELMRVSSEVNRVINRGLVSDLVQDRDRLIAQGWYKESEIAIQITGYTEYAQPVGDLIVNRINIKSAYSNIPLKLMAKFARENGVVLAPKLEQHADTILSKHPDLISLESRINSYVISVGNDSKPEDWIEDVGIGEIRNAHLHMSSKIGIGYMPRMRRNRRVRYYYDG